MSARNIWVGAGLVVLVAAAGAGLYWTREIRQPADEGPIQAAASPNAPGQRRGKPTDQRWNYTKPLLTARRLVGLATTTDEQEWAQQAVRLADHLVDLTFSEQMRLAAESRPDPTPELKALQQRKEQARQAVETDQQRIQQLTRQLASGGERESDRLQAQLEIVKAQLELAQDEMLEASDALERAGGDPQSKIRRLKELHAAAQKEVPLAHTEQVDLEASSLLGRFRAWRWQQSKLQEIVGALQETSQRIARVTKRREQLDQQLQRVQPSKKEPVPPAQPAPSAPPAPAQAAPSAASAPPASPAPAPQAAAPAPPATTPQALPERNPSRPASAAQLKPADLLRRVGILGRRLQDEQELTETYNTWKAVVEQQVRAALHRVILGALWIALTLLGVFFAALILDRLFRAPQREKARMATLRGVVKFGIQVFGLLIVLFIAFGIPSQATTILGLAGAGLTVAMKDFIVAFFGWFVLMGRNGIRVGDWVEIEGVGGEVAEITLLHTVLLETGSGTNAGHPTGRRVSFVNSYAIEGHYFDFTTSGQWTWDELEIVVPAGQDPYPTIDRLQQLVEKETKPNVEVADQEWRKTSSRYKVQTFSVTPGISVVPTSAGVELHVRYVTRAHERHETRRRLHLAVLELLHQRRPEAGTAA
jgi:small-conductance mechanosensitive channel